MIKNKEQSKSNNSIVLFTAILAICAIIGTSINVFYSNKHSRLVYRPWLSITSFSTNFDLNENQMEVKAKIDNHGKLPAFCYVNTTTTYGGEIKSTSTTKTIIIMPNVSFYRAVQIKGDLVRKILEKSDIKDIFIEINIKYSDKKKIYEKYFTYIKVKFCPDKLPHPFIKNKEYEKIGLWSTEDGDFK